MPTQPELQTVSGHSVWCSGQAFAAGDMPQGSSLPGVQMTVKSRWPDGSAKLAVLAGLQPQSVALDSGSAPSGRSLVLADLPNLSIHLLTQYGSATIDQSAPFVEWVSGPLMSSWIFRAQIDAHLWLWAEVRAWSTGDVEILPWIENGSLMVGAPGGRPGNYTLSIGGVTRFDAWLPVYHHTRQPLIDGAALSYWLGADKAYVPKHDADYLASTGLVQAYVPEVRRTYPALPGWQGVSARFKAYEPFSQAVTILSTAMGQGGGHNSIGIQPAWEAVALVDPTARGFEQLVRECYRMGAWQIHYRDERTGRALAFSDHPDLGVWNDPASGNLDNINEVQAGAPLRTPACVDGKGGQGNQWGASHQPAAPLLAYLMTGRWYFMDECQHIAGINFLISYLMRGGHLGLVDTKWSQLRQCAWTLRNLFIAACVTPDDDVLHPEYSAAVDANVEHFLPEIGSNPLGCIRVKRSASGGDQAWQFDFWTAAWAAAVRFQVGTRRDDIRRFFDWCSQATVGRAGGTGPDEFLYRFATTAVYSYPNESSALSGWRPDGSPWKSWGEFYEYRIVQQQGYTGPKEDGPLTGGNWWADTTGWWGMYMEAITACAALDAPGARDAMARLTAAPNWSRYAAKYAGQLPVNATTFVNLDVPPHTQPSEPPMTIAVGTRTNVNLNSADDVDYCATVPAASRWWNGYGGGNSSFASMVGSYSGGLFAPEYGSAGGLVVHGGGHGGNIGAFAYVFDLGTMMWQQIGAPRNLPPNSEWCGYPDARVSAARNEALEQRDPDWMDYNYNGSFIKFSDHEYLHNSYISPAEGGGPKGSLLLPQATFSQDPGAPDPRTGKAYRWAPHLMSLDDGTMTRATATTLGAWGAYSATCAVKDTTRNRLWYVRQSNVQLMYFDLGTLPMVRKTYDLKKANGQNSTSWIQATNAVYVYVPEADCIVRFAAANANTAPPAQANATQGVRVWKMNAAGMPIDTERTDIPTQAMPNGGLLIGVAWCPTLAKFYLYEGFGSTRMWTLTPSSLDFATCSWQWDWEEFTGPDPVSKLPPLLSDGQRRAAQGKLAWVPALGCLAWHDGPTTEGVCQDGVTRKGIVQLWAVPGTPSGEVGPPPPPPQPITITSSVLGAAGAVVDHVLIVRDDTAASIAGLSAQTLNASGQLVVSGNGLVAGQAVRLLTWSADGGEIGNERLIPA